MKIVLVFLFLSTMSGCGSSCSESAHLKGLGISINETSLLENSFKGEGDIVQELLSCGVDVNAKGKDGSSPLIYAANIGDVEMMMTLLKHGADVSIANAKGATALHAAAQNGSPVSIDILIKAGANKDAAGPFGRTPLFIAAESGKLEAIQMLLDLGANAAIRDPNEWTPAHVAASNGHLDVLSLLLSGNDSVSVNDSAIPLLIPAVASKRMDVVNWLLANGADPMAKSRNGETAIQIAELVGNAEALAVFSAR